MGNQSYYIIEAEGYLIFFAILLLVILVAGLVYFFVQLQQIKAQNKKLITTNNLYESKLNTVQLDFIETKLNPHLFKNILNSVQSYAYQTYISLDRLANILDYILYESNNRLVTPKEEMTFITSLIEINKIKISPLFDIKVTTKIDENDSLYYETVMAPLITVDLIENAFKHTDFLAENAFISIQIELEDGHFYLKVSNRSSKEQKPNEKGGFGSQSLEKRLKIIYENFYSLNKIQMNGNYTAILKINLREFHNKMRYTG